MLQSINALDIIFFILAFVIIMIATLKGFLNEVFSTAAWFVSFIICFLFYKSFAVFLKQYLGEKDFLYLISFLFLFVISYSIIKILHAVLANILRSPSIASFDHALGFFLGVIKAVLVILFIIFVLYFQKIFSVEKIFHESIVVQFLWPLVEKLLPETVAWTVPYV